MENFKAYLQEHPFWEKIIIILASALIIWLISRGVKKLFFARTTNKENRYRLNKVISFFAYFLLFLVIINTFSDDPKDWSIFAGAAGAGITIALQDVVLSFVAWFSIMFGGIFKAGDRVKIDGVTGDVISIGVLRTTIMEIGDWIKSDRYNGRMVYVANSSIFKNPVYNYSGDFPFIWDEIEVPLHYSSNLKEAKNIIYNVALNHTKELAQESQQDWQELGGDYYINSTKTTPVVSTSIAGDHVNLKVRFVLDSLRKEISKSKVTEDILKEIKQHSNDVKIVGAEK